MALVLHLGEKGLLFAVFLTLKVCDLSVKILNLLFVLPSDVSKLFFKVAAQTGKLGSESLFVSTVRGVFSLQIALETFNLKLVCGVDPLNVVVALL